MNNVRIAIRDSTDSHNVAFFDNEAGIKYKSANLQRFLAGSASILTLKYNSKDIDSIRSGCKLAFRYKARDYWLNIMKFEKQGFEVEITACSLHLELNNEERGVHKPDKAMSFAEYLAYYDPEHALTIGVNEVSDKRIKLEWTGTDTILARLFSIANSFDAELEFVTELNDDYSLKRHVLNVYKKGNLGSNKTSSPVRVGKELKVINYSDSIEDLRTAVRATGKDGLTIDGLNKKIYDDNGELLYYSSGNTVYAPQSRDRFPSVGQASNDNWIVQDLGETEYETKEALWGYMYGEIQKICLPKIEYKVTGAIDSDVGDTQTLIDDVHYEPPLYLKARVSELTDDILQGKVIDSTFINFERQYSQIADSLLKQVEALAEDAAPYIVRLSTDNGYNFKNGQGTSTITAKLEKYSKIVNANWKWLINNSIVSEISSVTINAGQVIGTLNVVAVASVDDNEVAREYITFTNSDDGVGIKSIKRYYTTNDQAEGVTTGGQNWSTKPTTVTADNNYLWSYDVITYTNDTSLVTEPAVIGARGDDGLDADTTGITEALDKAKQELTALSANIEKVRDDSLAAVEEAKQQLTTVANDLNTAKQDLQTQASQLQAQASAQSELTKRVSSVEETANGTKSTVSELTKAVAQNGKDITSVTARTKVVEDDLLNTKTTLSQVQTTANNTSQKTATLESGLDGVKADLAATTATADTTKTNLASYQASNDKAVANLQSNLQTANGNISSLQTKVEAVPGQITSAVSAVEGKIPTEIGGRNLYALSKEIGYLGAKGGATNLALDVENGTLSFDVNGAHPYFGECVWGGINYLQSYGQLIPVKVNSAITVSFSSADFNENYVSFVAKNKGAKGPKVFRTQKVILEASELDGIEYIVVRGGINNADGSLTGKTVTTKVKVEYGNVCTDWTPAPEDTASQINSLSSQIQQTADGMTLLATKTELNSAKSELQSGITTATSKADNAQATANSNAQTISTHTTQISALNTGLQAKVSQSDFNTLSGRVTTAENNITAKANELSSKISSLTVGNKNYLPTSKVINRGCTNFSYSETSKSWTMTVPASTTTFGNGITFNTNGLNILLNGGETLFFGLMIKASKACSFNYDINNALSGTTSNDNDDRSKQAWSPSNKSIPANVWTRVWFSYTAKTNVPITEANSNFGIVNNTEAITVEIKEVMVAKSNVPVDYQTPDADFEAKDTEFKQTTDAISASVSALDSSTVKTASLNLDNNGFVTKVGKTVNGNTFATMIAQDENDVQIIAKKMKVSGDMIVNGAITAEKLNINSLSALSADLGDVTSGSITNSFVDYTRSGTIKIDNSITIDTKDTSSTVANKANQHIKMNSSGFALTAENSSNTPAYSMQIMPESINFNKLDYDTTRGGTSGWSLTHNGYYSMLQVDMVWQNVRINNTSNMPYGTKANFVRIGNLVTVSVNRQITNINVVAENQLANETIPEGFRPITQAHLTLTGNTGSTIDATCICHLNPDGTIRFTNNKTGNRVWSGTVTYTCVEPMPYVKELNNGSTI